VTKFVNALSAASEIGGPSASAHLLGLPDHYTSHRFRPFFWRGYVRRALDDCPPGLNVYEPVGDENARGESDEREERVVLGSSRQGVVPLSKVNDYVCRPRELSDISLYDYMRRYDVRRRPRSKRATGDVEFNFEDEDVSDSEHDGEDSSSQAVDGLPEDDADGKSTSYYRFTDSHPLFATHEVRLLPATKQWTLNFSGGVLPRPDRGSHEEYCCVMLVLFSPGGWRSGADILAENETWSVAFSRTQFTDEYIRVMRNMNVLYECHDARDDFAA
ncbi:hypothetical protein FKP32DRAFT_1553074, partial [Trametes sanguinea]